MKNSKLLIFISLILLCGSLTLSANDPQKPTDQTNTNQKPIIKFKPGYKKHDKDTEIEDTYKRVVNVEVEKNIDDATMNKMGEERCRSYNLKQRQNYYVAFVDNKNGAPIKSIYCGEIEGSVIEGANKKSNDTPLYLPLIVQ